MNLTTGSHFVLFLAPLLPPKIHSEIGGQKHLIFIHRKVPEKLPAVEKGWFPRGGARRVFDFSQANVDFEDPEGYYELEG